MHGFHHIKRQWVRFGRSEEGLAFIEFAFSITVLLLFFLGAVEVSRFVLINQKLEKAVSTVTDIVTQVDPTDSSVTAALLLQLTNGVQDMMNPYTFGSNGLVIITDVTQAGASNPVVNWQYCGGGTLPALSAIGTPGGPANIAGLPGGFSMIAGEEVVIGEIFYNFQTITGQVIPGTLLYRTAVYMPRLGALTNATLPVTCQ